MVSFLFRGAPRGGVVHVLRSCDILLERVIVVSPWLGGPGCALPCFGFIGFRYFFVYCRMSGYWSSDCFGNGFRGVWGIIRSGRAHKPQTPRAGAKKYITGELDKGIVFGDMGLEVSKQWLDGHIGGRAWTCQ